MSWLHAHLVSGFNPEVLMKCDVMVGPLSIRHRSCIRLPLHRQYLLVQGNRKSLAVKAEIIHLLD